jgi:23S rRNA pseudouridine955/2504/2580 synthase
MSNVQIIAVAAGDADIRLDRWFRRHFPELGHGRLEKLLRTGQVRIDGKRARAGDRVSAGQSVRVPPLGAALSEKRPNGSAAASVSEHDAAAIRATVLHRDTEVIAINQPAGLAVQGGTGTTRHLDAMLDALRFEATERPRLVHRLDKDTSGVLLLARTAAAAAKLAAAFRHKSARKTYWAVVAGVPRPQRGRIDLPLAKLPGRAGEKMAPEEDGDAAVTYYAVIEQAGSKAAFLALMPITGRTHQLRAHCAAIGTPILGDGKYGGASAHIAGVPGGRALHLHAREILLPHPSGGTLRIEAPLPPHMHETWQFFGFAEDDGDVFADLEAERR